MRQMAAGHFTPVARASAETRASFITSTYNHLFWAIVAFTGLEVLYFKLGWAEPMARAMLGVNWLLVLGGFMILGYLGSRFAYQAVTPGKQYLGLSLYVVGESIIFVPLLFLANWKAPGVITSAATVTLIGFTALSALVFFTRKDFSFLGGLLKWGFIVALLAIVGGVLFGFQLGTWFSVAMVGLAGAAILHSTSRIMLSFPEDRPVAAALELFSAVALLFWYVLSLFMSRD